ncbi:MAG TPA: polysaccharide deacetylase family protein [Gaiellaceae bacterium]|nr:polysaccharide deacetylase family protein [Gaiellaceae bacterium]
MLVYHRIAQPSRDPQLLAVSPEHFGEHLQAIVADFEPLRLLDLVEAAVEGRLPRRAIAITFDDGYADNLLVAKPLLERAGIPATVFVTSSNVGDGSRFWWDELERLLLSPGRVPALLELEISGEPARWELGPDAEYSAREAAKRAGWTVLDDRDPGPRQQVYRELCKRLRELEEGERAVTLERLRALVQLESSADREPPRPLTVDELERLGDDGLVEIGAHTKTHPVLSQLPPGTSREEILGSKQALEDVLGRPVSAFAYPYGGKADFDESTISIVREAGFDTACSTIPRRVGRRTDPLRVPRLVVRDWTGPELAGRLAGVKA